MSSEEEDGEYDSDMMDQEDYDIDDNENLLEEYEEEFNLEDIDDNILEIRDGSEIDEDEIPEGEELEAELEAQEQEEKARKIEKAEEDTNLKRAQATTNLFNAFINCQKNFIHRQKALEYLNQLPKTYNIAKYEQANEKIQKKILSMKILLASDIYDSMIINEKVALTKKTFRNKLQNFIIASLSTSSQKDSTRKKVQPKVDTESLYNLLEDGWTECTPELEEISNKWFRQTSLNENDKSLAKKIKQLNAAPFEKVREMLEVPRELIKKSRLRQSGLKIIGEEKAENEDDETYDDKDLVNDYMRSMMSLSDSGLDDVEDGLYFDSTRNFLKIREAKIKKKVDTKASKNRKIRYDTMDKLVGFVAPRDIIELEGRDDIMMSLFGGFLTKRTEYLAKRGEPTMDDDNEQQNGHKKLKVDAMGEDDIDIF